MALMSRFTDYLYVFLVNMCLKILLKVHDAVVTWGQRFFHDLLRSLKGLGNERLSQWPHNCRKGIKNGLLTGFVSHFRCRPALSCSIPHPFRTSQFTRPIGACCTLYKNSVWTMPPSAAPHVKSRCPQYPGSKVKRFLVPDDMVDWSKSWPQYDPVNYTDPSVLKKPAWADPEIGSAALICILLCCWIQCLPVNLYNPKYFFRYPGFHTCCFFSQISGSVLIAVLVTFAYFAALSLQNLTLWMVLWTEPALRASTKSKRESHCKLINTTMVVSTM